MTNTKVLLVDDDSDERYLTRKSLENQNCDVVSASNVTEALHKIDTQPFDVLVTDLNMPEAGDGFAVVTAMHHTQPDALNVVVSDFPDVNRAMDAIALQADEVLVKPLRVEELPEMISKKIASSESAAEPKETVASILDREFDLLIKLWLERMNQVTELRALRLSDAERTANIREMVAAITERLLSGRKAEPGNLACAGAIEHGKLRFLQGYTLPLMMQEMRLLQMSIFEIIDRNVDTVDFTLLLPDLMTIADEMNWHSIQSVQSLLGAQSGAPSVPLTLRTAKLAPSLPI
jgi:ActR/RegA family two-component response regulator